MRVEFDWDPNLWRMVPQEIGVCVACREIGV